MQAQCYVKFGMTSRLESQTNIRLPTDLKQALVDAAAENRRSLTAEMVARLEESFSGRIGSTVELGEKSLDAIESRLRSALKHK